MLQPFKTISCPSNTTLIIKRSKFIGSAFPAANEQEAIEFIRQIKETYRDATHHCYAYIIGSNAGISRYSDGGEPGGTAGLPILEAIKARDLVHCCIIVTRYFGGILLGAGGLARAYNQSAALSISAAGLVFMEPAEKYMLEIAYPLWNKAMHIMEQNSTIILSSWYTEIVRAEILVRHSKLNAFISQIRLLAGDRAMLESRGEQYAPRAE